MVGGVPGRSRRGGGRPPLVRGGGNASGSAPRRAGAGQQQRQVGAVLGGMGQGRVAQLVQRPPGAGVKQFGRPPVRQPGPAAGLIQVQAGHGADRPAVTQKTGPLVRPASRRGSSWADPVGQNTHSTAPPLRWTRARRLASSRSCASKARSSLARAAVSYSRHRVRSRSGRSRWANSRSSCPRVRARVRSMRSRSRSWLAFGGLRARRSSEVSSLVLRFVDEKAY
jgi:hypothetical protein